MEGLTLEALRQRQRRTRAKLSLDLMASCISARESVVAMLGDVLDVFSSRRASCQTVRPSRALRGLGAQTLDHQSGDLAEGGLDDLPCHLGEDADGEADDQQRPLADGRVEEPDGDHGDAGADHGQDDPHGDGDVGTAAQVPADVAAEQHLQGEEVGAEEGVGERLLDDVQRLAAAVGRQGDQPSGP